MNVWGQLPARTIKFLLSYFQLSTAPEAEGITAVVKTIINETTILGHSITKLANYVSTEEVLHSTTTSNPPVTGTTSLSQSSGGGFDSIGSTASFDWSVFGFVFCLVCLSAFIGLCLGSLHYRGLLSPVRLPLRDRPFLPLFHGIGNGDQSNGTMVHHYDDSSHDGNTLGLWFHRAQDFLKSTAATSPPVFKSQLWTFVSGMVVYHVGRYVFDPAKSSDDGVSPGDTKGTWTVLTGLFYLFRQGGHVVRQGLHLFKQTMFAAILVLITHWFLTILIAGTLALAMVAIAKWRSMDWQAQQQLWFKFLYLCIQLRALLGEIWPWCSPRLVAAGSWCSPKLVAAGRWCSPKLAAAGHWCFTQENGRIILGVVTLPIEIGPLYFIRGVYKIHQEIRESKKQTTIDEMTAAHEAENKAYDAKMADKDTVIEGQEKQIASLNHVVKEIDTYKQQKEDAYLSKRRAERQCSEVSIKMQQEARSRVHFSTPRWQWSSQAKGDLTTPLYHHRSQHNTDAGQAKQQITDLGTKLEQATASCKEHLSRIGELQGDNAALHAQLKAKDEIIEAKAKLPEVLTAHTGLGSISQEVYDAVYQHLLASGLRQILDERPKLMEAGQELLAKCNQLEEQVKDLQSVSSAQQDSSGKLQESQARFNDLQARFNNLQKESKKSQTQSNDLQTRFDDLQKLFNNLHEEFKHVETVSQQKSVQKAELEKQNENSMKAHSKALEENSELTKELEALRASSQTNPQPTAVPPPPAAAMQTNSGLAAKIAYLNTFSNGTLDYKFCVGPAKGLQCLVASLGVQHGIHEVTLTDLRDICGYPINAAQIAAVRQEPDDNAFEYDPHQLAKILELWSRQTHGSPALLGVKSRVHGSQRDEYTIIGDEEGEVVVWMERSVPAKPAQTATWKVFGPVAEGAAASDT
ncbi:MAG: hypothetical protein LQ349_008743 [Xanthoria aureola]|nr:MAG: hypothetical protein LQ349_008743 [Xanthoria aureola]